MNDYFKIFGLDRTGTTYIYELIKSNTKAIVFNNELGFKHGSAKTMKEIKDLISGKPKWETFEKDLDDGAEIHPCVVIKNPYSWYWSIKNHITLSHKQRFDIDVWYGRYNSFYKHWLNLINNPYRPWTEGEIVVYEEVLRDPKGFLDLLDDLWEIGLNKEFVNPKKVMSSSTFTKERKKFYLQEGNFGLLPEVQKKITELIDWELVMNLGYEPIGEI